MIKSEITTPLLKEDGLTSTGMQFTSTAIDEYSVMSTEMFQIRYEKFNREVLKTQQRVAGMSMQRIKKEEAEVILEVSLKTIAQVADIKVYVKRMVEIENPPLGFVELKAVKYQLAYDKYLLHIDLDSVYMVDERVVYCLAKNNTDEKNRFFLKIEVIFIDLTSSVQYSKSFKVIGKLKEQKPKTNAELCSPGTWGNNDNYQSGIVSASIGINDQDIPYVAAADSRNIERGMVTRKRSRTDDSISSMDSFDRVLRNLIEEKEGHLESDKLIQASRVVADHIKAKSADIEELYAVNQIKTPRGDIAYHFVLKDPDNYASFQEGELVGIFNNDKQERVLDKLSQQNSHEAIMRGVITRSYFLEAQAQPNEVLTETICMFGIVPVRVKGSIHRGDVLYSSESHPGAAVSGSAFTQAQVKEYATIGFALETMKCDDDEFNLIQCLVSVTMEVFGGMMQKRIKQVEGVMGSQVEKIRRSRKKSKRMLYACFIGTTILAGLIGILLWQMLMPCTAYKYWRCRQGRIKDQIARFRYVSLTTPTDYTPVSGVEFEFDQLKYKTKDMEGVLSINGTGFHYYLNVEHCACKTRVGPIVFAIDITCTHVLYYYDLYQRWCVYRSATLIKCYPFYSYGHRPALVTKICTWLD